MHSCWVHKMIFMYMYVHINQATEKYTDFYHISDLFLISEFISRSLSLSALYLLNTRNRKRTQCINYINNHCFCESSLLQVPPQFQLTAQKPQPSLTTQSTSQVPSMSPMRPPTGRAKRNHKKKNHVTQRKMSVMTSKWRKTKRVTSMTPRLQSMQNSISYQSIQVRKCMVVLEREYEVVFDLH